MLVTDSWNAVSVTPCSDAFLDRIWKSSLEQMNKSLKGRSELLKEVNFQLDLVAAQVCCCAITHWPKDRKCLQNAHSKACRSVKAFFKNLLKRALIKARTVHSYS